MKKVLLYSGGMDSYLISKIWKPDVKLYIDIDGKYSAAEKEKLPKDVQIVSLPLLGLFEQEDRYIPQRNLYFLMIASHYGDEICLGATAGDGGQDKSLEFLEKANEIINYLWQDKKAGGRNIKVVTDFVKMSKRELVETYIRQGGSVETLKQETFSCYTPGKDGKECMSCYPCFRKYALLSTHGFKYQEEERRSIWNYVRNFVIPTKQEGGYNGTYYTDRGDESKSLVAAVNELKNTMGE